MQLNVKPRRLIVLTRDDSRRSITIRDDERPERVDGFRDDTEKRVLRPVRETRSPGVLDRATKRNEGPRPARVGQAA